MIITFGRRTKLPFFKTLTMVFLYSRLKAFVLCVKLFLMNLKNTLVTLAWIKTLCNMKFDEQKKYDMSEFMYAWSMMLQPWNLFYTYPNLPQKCSRRLKIAWERLQNKTQLCKFMWIFFREGNPNSMAFSTCPLGLNSLHLYRGMHLG